MTDTRTALPDDAWGADTRRILARQDEAAATLDDDTYSALLANALSTPAN